MEVTDCSLELPELEELVGAALEAPLNGNGDGPIFGRAGIDAATKGDKNERIYLRADKAVSYGDLMEVMNLLRNAGYLKIALVGLDGRS